MKLLKPCLLALSLLTGVLLSYVPVSFVQAQDVAMPNITATTPAPTPALVQPQRDPNYACTQCHKKESEQMHGKHASVVNPNNLGPVTCTNCHGNPSPRHREGVNDVMVFTDENMPLDQRNGVCLSCHEPDNLRKTFWAHDVHVTKTSCTNCHQLHTATEPMMGISDKARIGLCVDCHSQQHAEKAASKSGVKESP